MSRVKAMKAGDLLSVLEVELRYRDPDLVLDIPPGTTCVFTMRAPGASSPKINRQPATVVSSSAGVVLLRYTWSGTDTNTAGEYEGEFEFTIAGKKMTAPTSGHLTIRIEEDLD